MGHRHSIKTRVSIWYAFLIAAIMVAFAIILSYISNVTVIKASMNDLTEAVDSAVDKVGISEGRITISPEIEYDTQGVRIALFDGSGMDISGLLPQDFPEDVKFRDDEVRTVGERGNRYYVYDRLIESRTGDLWVRGVMTAEFSKLAPDIMAIFKFMILLFPALFIVALIGGFIITTRAFRPLKKITDTAVEISSSGDLSRRIGYGDTKSHDEAMRAAGVFDEMLEKLEKSFENEKQFTNDASHELRTPTAVIMAQSEYALENMDDMEEVNDSLETIHAESIKMDKLVSQLLMLARSDRGTLKLSKKKTDISLLAEEACEMNRPFAAEKGITIKTDCDEGIYMNADPVFFTRIYENLITNAIRYGKENGHITVSVKDEGAARGGGLTRRGVVIKVEDDGIGISEEALPHIFERFYRENRSFNKDSTGLGLPIVRWIVTEHGGIITCSSEKGKGTVFEIRF